MFQVSQFTYTHTLKRVGLKTDKQLSFAVQQQLQFTMTTQAGPPLKEITVLSCQLLQRTRIFLFLNI